MATVVLLVSILGCLFWWDLLLKTLSVVSRPLARAHLERRVSSMARRLLVLARCYGGLGMGLDPGLVRAPSPCLVCANHQSVLDIVVLLAGMKSHRLRFVAKRELARGFPAVSEVLRIQRHALINREGDYRKTAADLRRLGRGMDAGVSPVVFPEGTRSRTGEVREFYPGAVRTVLSGKTAPIVAVAVDGGYRLVGLKDLRSYLGGMTYRARLVGVFGHSGSKQSLNQALARAHEAIERQIRSWREAETR